MNKYNNMISKIVAYKRIKIWARDKVQHTVVHAFHAGGLDLYPCVCGPPSTARCGLKNQ